MALIKCPECGKEISERANVCPNCGFPIKEYLENEQKKRDDIQAENRKKKLKNVTETKHHFQFFSNTISLSINDVICGLVQTYVNFSFEHARHTFFESYKSSLPSDFEQRDLEIILEEMYKKTVIECVKSIEIINEFAEELIHKNGMDYSIDEWNYVPLNYGDLFDDVANDFYKLRSF